MSCWRCALYVDTVHHKLWVFWYALKACRALLWRAIVHDLSKFSRIEAEGYTQARPLFRQSEYGSPGYKQAEEILKPAFEHHCSVNTHHPEHFGGEVARMSLLDQLEMLIDWKASARYRHEELRIDINVDKFHLADAQEESLLSTAGEIGL